MEKNQWRSVHRKRYANLMYEAVRSCTERIKGKGWRDNQRSVSRKIQT